jgi:hypothetical protein
LELPKRRVGEIELSPAPKTDACDTTPGGFEVKFAGVPASFSFLGGKRVYGPGELAPGMKVRLRGLDRHKYGTSCQAKRGETYIVMWAKEEGLGLVGVPNWTWHCSDFEEP